MQPLSQQYTQILSTPITLNTFIDLSYTAGFRLRDIKSLECSVN